MIRFHAISRRDGGDHDGIHLLWSPPFPAGHSLDGFTIVRRESQREKEQFCFTLSASLLATARSLGHVTIPEATIWSRFAGDGATGGAHWTYRVALTRRHSVITVSGGPALAVFAGLADGTVIAGGDFTATSSTLHGTDIGVLWLVSDSTRSEFRICGNVVDDRQWRDARLIVKNLQLPFASVNPAVSTNDDGRALAKVRAQPDSFEGDFDDVSRYANAALARPDDVPAWRVISERPGEGGNAWDVSPFGLAIAPTILPAWHRGLGFAFLDREELTPGERYDYRIVGTVRRRDRDEQLYDLHTVARGYRLPRCFRWGTAMIWVDTAPVVTALSTVSGEPSAIRKGFGARRLVVMPDAPTPRIVLELVPGVTVFAKGFRHGAPIGAVSVASSRRTVLDFAADADRIVIEGELSIMGIVPHPLDPSLDPNDTVAISQTIHGIEFVPTAPPPAPSTISVVNLSDPSRTAARGVLDSNRGFDISWDAPDVIPASALPYFPVDATSARPTDVARYRLERAWGGNPFAPGAGDGTQLSGRNAPSPTDTPAWGFDLLAAFPPADVAPGSHTDLVHAIETFEAKVLRYGDDIIYRVFSVDVTGRESPARTSAPTPLRKFVRPPVPATPPITAPVDPAIVPVSGVHVRLYQQSDPELTASQRALAADSDVVHLRWGWGPTQRDFDPDVVEFRVYEHDGPLTLLKGRTTSFAVVAAMGWSIEVHFDTPVAVNEFASLVVVLGVAFRIISHGAGTNVTLVLAPNPVNAIVAPAAGEFTVGRTTSVEFNSEYWHRRVAIVPRVPVPADSDVVEEYTITLPAAWIAVDASRTRQTQGIGVTAADAEGYVADRRLAVEAIPRAGNESTVAAVEVTARYFGRPSLAIADLADVAALTVPRQAGDDVHGTIRPADALPPGFVAAPRMRLERVPAGAVLPRLRISPTNIQLLSSGGTASEWTLSASDQATLRAEDAAGMVSDRFLAHAAARLDGLEATSTFLSIVDPAQPFTDTLPNRPSRWLYRLRAVDAAGHPSPEGQLLPLVVHVPSPARSVAPQLEHIDVSGGIATVHVRARGASGETIYVFHSADNAFPMATATLSTIRNRPDLAADVRLVVRDNSGRRLMPTLAVPDASGVALVPVPSSDDGSMLHVWALSLTADGVPSRLVGPMHAALLVAGS
ncbi:MAG: hypothetical protein ABIP66_02245 [Gemmatimonadaceae bacterium]